MSLQHSEQSPQLRPGTIGAALPSPLGIGLTAFSLAKRPGPLCPEYVRIVATIRPASPGCPHREAVIRPGFAR
jgi:hypothetical protein